ncbi:MAG: hypothetical protein L0Y57_15355 [Beijerinckiaceae bacterium]|nr:hypothetical protein [Beijerinckiaceae bacterium]
MISHLEASLAQLKGSAVPEDTENIVLEHLRHIRPAIGHRESRLVSLTTRIGHLARSFAHLQTSLAHVQVQPAEHSDRFDRVESRLARIEKRLELADD